MGPRPYLQQIVQAAHREKSSVLICHDPCVDLPKPAVRMGIDNSGMVTTVRVLNDRIDRPSARCLHRTPATASPAGTLIGHSADRVHNGGHHEAVLIGH